MTNLEVARIFRRIADLLELQGEDHFRVEAYRRVAAGIETTSENIESLRERDALREIPGVGAGTAAKLEELLDTGRLHYLEELETQTPPGLVELMAIPGLGPKKVRALWKGLGVATIDALEEAAKAQRVRALSGFGAKSEANILRGIEDYRAHRERMRLGEALPYAEALGAELRAAAGAALDRLEIAGSARRRAETVGDLDFVATAADPERAMEAFVHLPQAREVLLHGSTRSTVRTESGITVDLRIVPPESFGSLLQHSTGSKAHNIRLRELAQSRGATLSEYGLFDVRSGERLASTEEECAVYRALGLACVPPELREDRGEIEAAAKDALPRLVTLAEIHGDLHAHTKWSDGASTVAEMADAAKALGYEYLALTDHSPSLEVAHGLTAERVRQRAAEIAEYNSGEKNFRVLSGTECDILPDGSLDYPDEILAQFDLVVASVHSRFNMSEEEMTNRVVKAIETKRVHILGHPTGRLINRREPYPLNLERVFEAARRTGTAIEINGFPDRLDLRDVHARAAKEQGVCLALGSDSHHTQHLPLIQYGVFTARRAWLEAADLLNTKSLSALQAWLNARR